jgi:hypothetical protein
VIPSGIRIVHAALADFIAFDMVSALMIGLTNNGI